MNKQQKTPEITTSTKLLSFDLEANGLHGQAFAVGAVLMEYGGRVIDEFTARCKISGQADPWVEQNVLPAISDMTVTHGSYKAMREAFWRWYLRTEPKADYVLVNNGYPVEHRFLLDCQEADLDARYWQHPFPLLELSSLQLMLGQKITLKERELVPHHPLDDAKAAALTAFKVFELSGRIQS